MKTIIGVALAVIILAIGHFKYDIFGFNKQLEIDKTANVITEIRKISEFTTACFYEETVMHDHKAPDGTVTQYLKNILPDDKLVIIVRGNVRAGFDLADLAQSIRFSDDTVSFRLPQPRIFNTIVNPSDYDVFIEEGKWPFDKSQILVNKAKAMIEADAISNGIYNVASDNGEKKLRQLFTSFGFNTVIIEK